MSQLPRRVAAVSVEGEPPLPFGGIHARFYIWYRSLPNALSLDKKFVRRTGFSPLTYFWAKASGSETKPSLLFETVGRKSGQTRGAVLPYWEVDGEYVVLGTRGGAPSDPEWVKNLRVQPQCAAWIGRKRVPFRARLADEEERERLSKAGVWHTWLDTYQYRARHHGREVQFVVLTPVSSPGHSRA